MSQPSCVQGQPEPLLECCLGHRRTASKQCCLTISLVRPELSSGLWFTIAQCLAAGLCALPLGTAAFFPHQPPSLRNWRLAADWTVLSWLRKGLAPSLMKEIVVFEVVYLCLFLLDMDITNTLTLLQIRCFALVLVAHVLIFNTSP